MTSRFHTTLTALETALTCDLIATPIDFAGEVPVETDVARIVAIARARRYDTVFVRSKPGTGPVKLTKVADVDRKAGSVVVRPILATELVSAKTRLGDTLELLSGREPWYVLIDDRIQLVLTRADLNKLPVQVYVATVITHLETLIAHAITRHLPGDAWVGVLHEAQRVEAERRQRALRRRDYDTTLIACIGLPEKVAVLGQLAATMPLLRRRPDQEPELVAHLLRVRNQVFHAQPLTNHKDVQVLAGVITLARSWLSDLAADGG